jgi:hypothetical protein
MPRPLKNRFMSESVFYHSSRQMQEISIGVSSQESEFRMVCGPLLAPVS